MKAENETTGHNRYIRFTDLPLYNGKIGVTELVIEISVAEGVGDGSRVEKAISLDNAVIPAILRAINGEVSKSEREP